MHGLLLAPLAPFFNLDFSLDFFLVLSAPVVDALAFGAREFYEKIL